MTGPGLAGSGSGPGRATMLRHVPGSRVTLLAGLGPAAVLVVIATLPVRAWRVLS